MEVFFQTFLNGLDPIHKTVFHRLGRCFCLKILDKYYEACMDLCMLSMLSTIQTTLEVVLRHCSELEMSNH